jgi:low affinity Fe/Cu permease
MWIGNSPIGLRDYKSRRAGKLMKFSRKSPIIKAQSVAMVEFLCYFFQQATIAFKSGDRSLLKLVVKTRVKKQTSLKEA